MTFRLFIESQLSPLESPEKYLTGRMTVSQVVGDINAQLESRKMQEDTSLNKYGPIPVESGRMLWKSVKDITGIPFKNKRFTGLYANVSDEAGGVRFSISGNGILVVESYRQIPNFMALVSFFKKHFGDVHTNSDGYINCRKFGEKEVNRPKYWRVGKLGLTEDLIKDEQGQLYVMCIGTRYKVQDIEDAKRLVKLINVRSAALRQAEIEDWKRQDFSSPNG